MHSASAVQPTTLSRDSFPADPLSWRRDAEDQAPSLHLLCLPILTRSASLLNLLLQDGTVDLELTSSVVALDPGLAFTTLQLANRRRHHGDEAIWQFPLAVVAAGQRRLLQAVNQAPKIESYSSIRMRSQLRQLWVRAVERACVARVLMQQLGGGNPRQAYLAGLLLGVPDLFELTFPSCPATAIELQTASRKSLPLEIDSGILEARRQRHPQLATLGPAQENDRPQSSLAASLQLAELLLQCSGHGSLPSAARIASLAAGPLWQGWEESSHGQRTRLLERGGAVARWAAANSPVMNPWEFAARLERSRGWE